MNTLGFVVGLETDDLLVDGVQVEGLDGGVSGLVWFVKVVHDGGKKERGDG